MDQNIRYSSTVEINNPSINLSPAEAAQWKLKAKLLGVMGVLLMIVYFLSVLYPFVYPLIFNMNIEDFNAGYDFVRLVPASIIWFVMGLCFVAMPNIGSGKIGGCLLAIYGAIRLLNYMLTFIDGIYQTEFYRIYGYVLMALDPSLIIASGILIDKGMRTGASRMFCIVMIIIGIFSFVDSIISKAIISYVFENGYDHVGSRLYVQRIWEYSISITCIIIYLLLAISLCKMTQCPGEQPCKAQNGATVPVERHGGMKEGVTRIAGRNKVARDEYGNECTMIIDKRQK